MSNFLSVVFLFVVSSVAFAEERAVQDAPVEKADPIALVIFGLIFFGMIGYYIWYIWRKDRESKEDQK